MKKNRKKIAVTLMIAVGLVLAVATSLSGLKTEASWRLKAARNISVEEASDIQSIEIFFPEHDVHFIAVNDGVDSNQEDNEFTPFRNIINEWYAKDTSKKIRAVKRSKGMAGEHIGSHPPYGYRKNPENKKEWIVDEEAAEVVREIFRLCVSGYGPTQIAKMLTEREILCPTTHWKEARNRVPYSLPINTHGTARLSQ